MTDTRSETPAPIGAGGDPLAIGSARNPYNVLPQVSPDDNPKTVNRLMHSLQRRKLTPDEDQAFRALRNLPFRLGWDFQTLGTTPSVANEEWVSVRSLVVAGKRHEVLPEASSFGDLGAALHVRAVLSMNEIAWQTANGGADDEALARYVAWWASLLSRKEWLRNFALARCRVWGVAAPDAPDLAEFYDRSEKAVSGHLLAAAGTESDRSRLWSVSMEQERAAIQAVATACGGRREPPAWASGYGPLGLRILGQEVAAQEWICTHAQSPAGDAFPLSTLKSSPNAFYQLDQERVANAARAVQMLFSELGHAACAVWNGQAARARERIQAGNFEAAKPGSWFGTTGRARRQRDEACRLLKAETLLLQFQEELSRPEVTAPDVCETAARILAESGFLPQPRVAVRQIEARICGRLAWCVSGEQLPDPREVERVLNVSLEVYGFLKGRGEGQQCSLEIAKLLTHRAIATWNRAHQKGRGVRFGEPESVLRDLFHAVELAPHSQEVVGNLAGLALQFPVGSPAERRSLLEKALVSVESCLSIGKTSPQMEEFHNKLLEIVNAPEARRLAIEKLRKAVGGGRQLGND